ncbi:MAG TPA: hypothetical protein VJ456_15990 [Acidimicrobiia bacterium]|nr:hypothetical protein [Acidimicrobiia bacterium]
MKQSVFTVVADVDPGRLDGLRATLAEIAADPAGNTLLPFARFGQLHFASIVLATGPQLPAPQLILEANVDGSADAFLDDLVATAPAGLDALYAATPGYPGRAPEPLRAWLEDRIVWPRAYHIGACGRSVARITEERRLHQAIGAYLDREDRNGGLKEVSAAELRVRIVDQVAAEEDLASVRQAAPPRQTGLERFRHRARAVAVVAMALALSPILLPLLLVVAVVLLVLEQRDPVQAGPPDPAEVRLLEADEDRLGCVQNHLASVIPVKRGPVRIALLQAVLYAVNLVARISATKGKLSGIPSIHFAHWSLIDEDRHLLFMSNFDGSWESYLGDFIDKAAVGLTAVWSNTVEFPRTRLLALRGATDGPRFRQWARAHQCRTDVWYSAYPDLSMPAIQNNSAIRDGLVAGPEPEETQRWLRRL